jgi:hypothetical protein
MLNAQVKNSASGKSFWDRVIAQKLSKPIVLFFLLFASLFISALIAEGGVTTGLLILILIIGLPSVYAVVAYPKFGIIVLILVSFLINFASRLVPEDTPIGLVMDALTYLLILGFFIKQKKEKQWGYYFNNPISYFILAWLVYNLIEVLNPAASSLLAWVYTVRTVAFLMLMYFVFVFHIRSKDFIKLIFKIWLALELLAAISAFQQENIGFFPFEKAWLNADPLRLSLLFINGHMRKFGIFSDPVVFAYNMVAGSLLCLAFIISRIKVYKKIILGFLMCFFLTVMIYSATRSSYVLMPLGLVMLTILNFNKKILVFVVISGLMFFVLIKIPTSNPSLARFQSAFRPSKDASFNVRAENQRRIKPYILSHPIGGGLGSVGIWGQRFAPDSYLAKFPPDSGYVRVAVEMGWIGLFLFCLFNFVVLYKGISYYYYIKDPELKTYCLAMILIIFALDFGNFPQQAFVQYPSNILIYLAMAILVITMRLDIEQREQYPATTG